MVGVRWGGWAQESDAWVPSCLPLVPGSPGLPEPLVLRLEKGSVSQGRSISVANAHQHQPMGIKTATWKLTLRHDVAETPLLPPLPPIASCCALSRETAGPAGGPWPQVAARVISRSPPARSDSPASSHRHSLIPACASSGLAFHMMYSAYKLNKQGDNIQP